MHEETAGKETGRERKWKLVERRKTGSRIYDREKVGFKGQGGERKEGMTKKKDLVTNSDWGWRP